MATPTIDYLLKNNLVMHDHSEADLGAILDSRYVNVTGDTMTGALVITPTANSTSILKVTNQAGTSVLNIDTTNRVTELTGASTITTLGAELVTNGTFETADNWTFNTNWAFDGTAKTAKHTAGSTATLGAIYYVYFQIKTRTAGTVAVSLNGTGAGVNYNSSDTFCPLITAGASGGLVFTPSSDFDGSIDNVSIKLVTRIGNSIALKDASGTTRVEIRPTQGGNIAMGVNALRHISITTGDNIAIGENALPVDWLKCFI